MDFYREYPLQSNVTSYLWKIERLFEISVTGSKEERRWKFMRFPRTFLKFKFRDLVEYCRHSLQGSHRYGDVHSYSHLISTYTQSSHTSRSGFLQQGRRDVDSSQDKKRQDLVVQVWVIRAESLKSLVISSCNTSRKLGTPDLRSGPQVLWDED